MGLRLVLPFFSLVSYVFSDEYSLPPPGSFYFTLPNSFPTVPSRQQRNQKLPDQTRIAIPPDTIASAETFFGLSHPNLAPAEKVAQPPAPSESASQASAVANDYAVANAQARLERAVARSQRAHKQQHPGQQVPYMASIYKMPPRVNPPPHTGYIIEDVVGAADQGQKFLPEGNPPLFIIHQKPVAEDPDIPDAVREQTQQVEPAVEEERSSADVVEYIPYAIIGSDGRVALLDRQLVSAKPQIQEKDPASIREAAAKDTTRQHPLVIRMPPSEQGSEWNPSALLLGRSSHSRRARETQDIWSQFIVPEEPTEVGPINH